MDPNWINFFEYLTSASAAILAIAFAAFSLSPGYWKQNALRHTAGVMSIVELAIPLFFGLMYLPPGHHWIIGGWLVGSFGYLAIFTQLVVAGWYRFRRKPKFEFELMDKLQIFAGVPMVSFTFSLMLWYPSLSVKAWTCVWLIFSGLSEAWISLNLPAQKVEAMVAHLEIQRGHAVTSEERETTGQPS